ncbi:hypothetical protein JOD65_003146 [Nocardioides cavernae]|nr:hypothetical protein [Nocardioides cavernae]
MSVPAIRASAHADARTARATGSRHLTRDRALVGPTRGREDPRDATATAAVSPPCLAARLTRRRRRRGRRTRRRPYQSRGRDVTEAERARASLAVGRSRPEPRGLHPKRGTGPWVEAGLVHSRRPKHASRSREPDASSRTARRGLGRRGSMRARPSLSRPGPRPDARRVGGTTRSTPSALRRRVVPVGGWGCLRLRRESPIDGHRPGAPQGLAMTNLDRKAPVRRVRHPEQRHRIARCAGAAAATSQAIRSSLILPVRNHYTVSCARRNLARKHPDLPR